MKFIQIETTIANVIIVALASFRLLSSVSSRCNNISHRHRQWRVLMPRSLRQELHQNFDMARLVVLLQMLSQKPTKSWSVPVIFGDTRSGE